MRVTIKTLSGNFIIEAEQITSKEIYNCIQTEMQVADADQIILKCGCERLCGATSFWKKHSENDYILYTFIKPIYSLQYVNLLNVSKFYQQNGTAIINYPDQVIWVNGSGGAYEISMWSSEKNHCTSERKAMSREELHALCNSEQVSPIAKRKIEWLLDERG